MNKRINLEHQIIYIIGSFTHIGQPHIQIQISIQVMSLKQHNDMVEKLLKQLDSKDSEIESLRKQLQKASSSQPMVKTTEAEKEANRKITQLHKQYKDKITQLTARIRSKSTENKDLKQRLNAMKNIQSKEKQQTAEILKKLANMTAHDPKFAAVVSHYESKLEKKEKYIANLQKQIKQGHYRLKQSEEVKKQGDQMFYGDEDTIKQNSMAKQTNMSNNYLLKEQQYHTKYQQEINSLKNESQKFQRLFEQKSKQFRDLSKRYSDLTKEYYRILNEYGESDLKKKKGSESEKGKGIFKSFQTTLDHPNEDIHQQFEPQPIRSIKQKNQDRQSNFRRVKMNSDQSLSYSFLTNLSQFANGPYENEEKEVHEDYQQVQSMKEQIQNFMEILGISSVIEIVPRLSKLKIIQQECKKSEQIVKFIQSMLEKIGMGIIPLSEIMNYMRKFQHKFQKVSESSDILDEICIEVGAKKQRVLQKIKDLKATEQNFFKNMKDIQYMLKLPKANKIVEFIEFFQLDKQICQLPEQLRKIYEQLKYVDRFIKQASIILERQPQGIQKSLEFILRFLERKQAEECLRAEKTSVKQKK